MLGTLICVGLAIACLVAGAVEGAIAMGILAAIVYFFFGSKSASTGSKAPASKPQKPQEPQPEPQYRATPALVAHYRESPVVAQIARELIANGCLVSLNFPEGGRQFNASGTYSYSHTYSYIFKDHGYQDLSVAEQAAFLVALIEMLPHCSTYTVGYMHWEDSNTPLNYYAKTSYYNDYYWNEATKTWEKKTKL